MSKEDYTLPNTAPEPPEPPTPRRKKRDNPLDLSLLETGLPANIDAEKTILGAILLDNEAWYEASEKLAPDDFSMDSHRRIYLRMRDLIGVHQAIDIVTLSNELAKNKEIESVGGVAYLASLTEGLPMRPVIEDYIRIVKDKALLRAIMLLCGNVIARAADQSEAGLEIAGSLGSQIEEAISGGIHQGLEPASNLIIEVLDKYDKQSHLARSPGLSWGIECIDVATAGIQHGEQVVVGCYSGVGKTTLLAQMVAENCPKGHPAAMFLIEPTRHTFLRQLCSIVGDIRYEAVTRPWIATPEEKDRMRWAANVIVEWEKKGQLYIMDKSKLSLDEQIAHGRLAIHRHGVELIGIDYLQRMYIPAIDKHEDTRLKIGRASIANAELVKNEKCCSVLLSQLSRNSPDSLPTMGMLRESGQIENDAAQILLLHLKWDADQGHYTDEGAGVIPKQRFGVPCSVPLHKDSRTAKWCSGTKEEAKKNAEVQQSLYK